MKCDRRHFMKGSALGGMAMAALEAFADSGEMVRGAYGAQAKTLWGKPYFRNWTGNVRGYPQIILSPESLDELCAVVAAADKVKAVGSGHSFTPSAFTDGTMISTERMTGLIDVNPDRRLVKVKGGTKIHQFNDLLAHYGLALPSLGDVAVQAVAGAIATGTHGTGLQWGSLSDRYSVHAIEMVLADGSVLELSEDRPEDRAALRAARLGLGLLGVVYSITFQVDTAHNLELHSRLMDLEDALDPEHYRKNDHFEFFRFPFTEKVQAISRNRTDAPARPNKIKTFFDKIILENLTLGAVLNVSSLHPRMMPKVMNMLTQLVPNERAINRSDLVMTSTRLVRAFEIEYAIPIDKAREMQDRFSALVTDFSQRSGEQAFYANFPCECRFIRGDEGTLLSPASEAEACYFSVASHIRFAGYEKFFREVEDQLLDLGGRPHWGKQFYRNPVSLYPRFSEFLDYKKKWDPSGKFDNIYSQCLLSEQEMLNEIG